MDSPENVRFVEFTEAVNSNLEDPGALTLRFLNGPKIFGIGQGEDNGGSFSERGAAEFQEHPIELPQLRHL